MKNLTFLYIFLVLLSACGGSEEKADVYGNFEATTLFVSAEVNGKLITFPGEEGETLDKGSLIAIIDTTQLHLKKEQLKATIAALKSRLQDVPVQVEALQERQKILEREVDRTRALLADSAATQKQLDDVTGELEVVRSQIAGMVNSLSTANQGILAEIKPLEWQIRQVGDQLAKSIAVSPIRGTILEKYREKGELVTTGQPLVKLADMDQMILRGYVSGDQLGTFRLGQNVTVRVDASDEGFKEYQARVSWISAEAEFTPKIVQTRDERVNLVYAVKFLVNNDGYLKIGMPAEVVFE